MEPDCSYCFIHPECDNHILVDIRTSSTDRQIIPVDTVLSILRDRNYDSDCSCEHECQYKRTNCERRIKMLNTCCGTITLMLISSLVIMYMSWIITGMINIA